MGKRLDVVEGQIFNRWTIIREVDANGSSRRFLCKCDCGSISVVSINHLRNNRSKSCGCLHKEIASKSSTTHGKSDSKIYSLYHGIKKRCYNPKSIGFKYWGGKGIKMCDVWLESFKVFEEWALSHGYEEGLSIERIDNDKDYCEENCIFIPRCEQPLNQSKREDNTSGYTGVYISGVHNNVFKAQIDHNKKTYRIGTFDNIRSAVMARNYFIIENNIPHKLQLIK